MSATTKQFRRIDRIVGNLGFCRRRDANKFIRQHVLVDGVRPPSQKLRVDPARLTIDGVSAQELMEPLTVALHKPSGFICSHARLNPDEKIVDDLLPPEWTRRRPQLGLCGRLDKDTTGLVLLTQDGQWSYGVTGKGHEREYEVRTRDPIEADTVTAFASGMTLRGEKEPLQPVELKVDGSDAHRGVLVMREGRNRQIRRMFEAVGNRVEELKRVRIAGITLGDLEEGKYRHVTADEVASVAEKA